MKLILILSVIVGTIIVLGYLPPETKPAVEEVEEVEIVEPYPEPPYEPVPTVIPTMYPYPEPRPTQSFPIRPVCHEYWFEGVFMGYICVNP